MISAWCVRLTYPLKEEEEVNPQEDPNAQIAARDADPEAKKKRQEEKDALLAELNDFKVKGERKRK